MATSAKESDRISDTTGTWVSTSEAVRRTGFSKRLLQQWAQDGCPFWGNRKPRSRRAVSDAPGLQPSRRYFLLTDLDEMLKTKAWWLEPANVDREWVDQNAATELCGVPFQALWDWRNGCSHLSGRKLRNRMGRRLDPKWNRFRSVREFKLTDLQQINSNRDPATDPGWLPLSKALEQFSFTLHKLRDWQYRRCPYVNGRRRLSIKKMRADTGAGVKTVAHFRRDELEQVQAAIDSDLEVFSDVGARWLTGRGAFARYGINPGQLNGWCKHTCRHLGRTINGQHVSIIGKEGCRGPRRWVYHEDDLRAIVDGRRKGSTLSQAKLFLRQALIAGPALASKLRSDGATAGIPYGALLDARGAMRIKTRMARFGGPKFWCRPGQRPPAETGAATGTEFMASIVHIRSDHTHVTANNASAGNHTGDAAPIITPSQLQRPHRPLRARDHLWLSWFENEVPNGVRPYPWIRDRWNSMTAAERSQHGDRNALGRGKAGYDVVRKAIEKATAERGENPET